MNVRRSLSGTKHKEGSISKKPIMVQEVKAEVCLLNIVATRAKTFITKMIKYVGLPGAEKKKEWNFLSNASSLYHKNN